MCGGVRAWVSTAKDRIDPTVGQSGVRPAAAMAVRAARKRQGSCVGELRGGWS